MKKRPRRAVHLDLNTRSQEEWGSSIRTDISANKLVNPTNAAELCEPAAAYWLQRPGRRHYPTP